MQVQFNRYHVEKSYHPTIGTLVKHGGSSKPDMTIDDHSAVGNSFNSWTIDPFKISER